MMFYRRINGLSNTWFKGAIIRVHPERVERRLRVLKELNVNLFLV